jgi:predicted PurR-regulated permease PerM
VIRYLTKPEAEDRRMWLQTRMFLLVALLFGILYGVLTAIGTWLGGFNPILFLGLAFVFLGIQYFIGPAMEGDKRTGSGRC